MKLLHPLKVTITLAILLCCATVSFAQQSEKSSETTVIEQTYSIKPVYNAVQQQVLSKQKNTQSSKHKVKATKTPKYYTRQTRVGDKPYVSSKVSTKKKVAKKPTSSTNSSEE